MYGEYFYVICDYFSTLTKKEIRFEIFLPLAIAILSCCYTFFSSHLNLQYEFITSVMPFIGTLLGLTLAALTILLSNSGIEEKTKEYQTQRKIGGKQISIYRLIVIFYSYLIVVETILCIAFYIASLFPIPVSDVVAAIVNTVFIMIVFHVLLATVRIVTNLYFIAATDRNK